jgi:imidazolonepropionase-like amidohydrolase
VTTARDLGAPTEPALTARAALDREGGLRLLVAGAPVTGTGAHLHFFGGAVATAAEAVELVRGQVGAGVDWVKLVLSGGEITPGSDPRAPALPDAAARAAVATARALGRPVAVHAHTAAAARLAVELAVETVEHCTLLDAGPAEVIAPPAVCPTANARWLAGSPTDLRQRGRRLDTLRAAGSTLIAGTDAGIPGVDFDAYADGLLGLHRAGLDPETVLVAATSAAARALGLPDRGALEPGMAGDLVALDSDPLEEVETLRRPRAVVVRGRRVSSR